MFKPLKLSLYKTISIFAIFDMATIVTYILATGDSIFASLLIYLYLFFGLSLHLIYFKKSVNYLLEIKGLQRIKFRKLIIGLFIFLFPLVLSLLIISSLLNIFNESFFQAALLGLVITFLAYVITILWYIHSYCRYLVTNRFKLRFTSTELDRIINLLTDKKIIFDLLLIPLSLIITSGILMALLMGVLNLPDTINHKEPLLTVFLDLSPVILFFSGLISLISLPIDYLFVRCINIFKS